jgi:hypothetical protein
MSGYHFISGSGRLSPRSATLQSFIPPVCTESTLLNDPKLPGHTLFPNNNPGDSFSPKYEDPGHGMFEILEPKFPYMHLSDAPNFRIDFHHYSPLPSNSLRGPHVASMSSIRNDIAFPQQQISNPCLFPYENRNHVLAQGGTIPHTHTELGKLTSSIIATLRADLSLDFQQQFSNNGHVMPSFDSKDGIQLPPFDFQAFVWPIMAPSGGENQAPHLLGNSTDPTWSAPYYNVPDQSVDYNGISLGVVPSFDKLVEHNEAGMSTASAWNDRGGNQQSSFDYSKC